MSVFIGVDLGWYGKPSGLASIVSEGSSLRVRNIARVEDPAEILRWIESETGRETAMVAVDAPLVIHNQAGIRDAERELNREFRRYHAGCHAANLGRPFAKNVIAFSQRLEAMGFLHGPEIQPKQKGRFQIEVHPHAATIRLFGLDRIVKYKRGLREHRATELRRLRTLMLKHLPELKQAGSLKLPAIPKIGPIKPAEDQIDAVLCAHIAALWWTWASRRNSVYGTKEGGYIVVPMSS